MRLPSMSEALKQSRQDRLQLSADSPYIYHDDPRWQRMSKSGYEEKAYYTKIYQSLTSLQKTIINQHIDDLRKTNNPSADGHLSRWVMMFFDKKRKQVYQSLTSLQKTIINHHARDIRKATKERKPFLERTLARIEATQTYQLLASAATLGYGALVTFAGAPFGMFHRPLQTLYTFGYFGIVYSFLFVANVVFLMAHWIGVDDWIRQLSETKGAGWSMINWLNINLFNQRKNIIDNAREALSGQLDDFLIPRHENTSEDLMNLAHQRPLEFNVDLARTILLMCSIMYERDVRFAQKAADAAISKTSTDDRPSEGVLFLLKSEEAMLRLAAEWGLNFVSMADFRKLSGPFSGAFYDFENIGPNDNPFIVIVVKGTSPDNFSEWIMDCACKFESAGDFLNTGLAHGGFYEALYPSRASGARTLPYMRMVETVKLIAKKAAQHTKARFGEARKVNLFVGGHSLGAGIAQLLFARFLESPEDLGDDVVLRDCYLFGTPRACDFRLASRVEYNLSRPANSGRHLWRVANRAESRTIGDIVTRVPPGLADRREIRAGMQDGSYYGYAAIGIRVDLTPNALSPPFYSIRDVPVGYEVTVVKKYDEAENEFARSREASQFAWPQDLVQLSMWLTTVMMPILHDHFPASYMDSLSRIQAKTTHGREGRSVTQSEKVGSNKAVTNAPNSVPVPSVTQVQAGRDRP